MTTRRDKPFRNVLPVSVSAAPGPHTHVEGDVTNLPADLALKAPIASPTFTGTVSGVSKTMVGLSNVPNTDATNAANISSGTLPDARNRGPLQVIPTAVTDCNSATDTGWWSITFGASNAPANSVMVGVTIVRQVSSLYAVQVCYGTISPYKMYRRSCDAGTWQAWTEVTSGGGGTGDVVGPASATNLSVAVYDGTTGKLIKDGGTLLSALATSSAVAAGYQPLDSDLTAIAALSPTNDDIVQRKAGSWVNRTMAQLKTDLAIAWADVSGAVAAVNALIASAITTERTAVATYTQKDFTATSNSFTAASTTQVGVSRLSTTAETIALSLATVGVTPASLNACLANLNYRDATALTGNVPITHGGTGVATLPSGLLKGAGTGAITAASAGTDFVAPGGALGTPSSGTLTNCTGPASIITSGTMATARLGSGTANSSSFLRGDSTWVTVYFPGGTDVPITDGGTGVSTLPSGLLKGAGVGAITAATAGTDYYAPGGTDVAVADGGTGASTAAGARANLGIRPAGWKFTLLATSGASTDPGSGNARFFTGGTTLFINYTDADSKNRASYMTAFMNNFGAGMFVMSDGTTATEIGLVFLNSDNGTWAELGVTTTVDPSVFTSGQPVYVVFTPTP